MTYEEFNQFCGAMTATSSVVQWGGAHVWKVGGKVFAIGGWGEEGRGAFTFKASELNFQILSGEEGYKPAPYMASRGLKWIQQYDDSPQRDDALKYYIEESYRLVSLGLTKKLQKELGLNQPE
ncbi:MmcQ/YjbR family DNA-binding protein [Marinomonas sp. C2222]|uniref:MmcQ/YjbR family DNA-binding protein n=1 Tax=Marinomonas sargassi TaxID=2984494 RepID=A0ABT2YPK3_9GAMM|nr:MmcQ/YjbR family DNA-binding protein [Marinomonas sargassi]MCV2401812.1 MmcQ/YjbR family DNA-binding protein [Marinomonas sargassi]